jgi:DNA repair exonuclease SbcCD ATPase subunit/DNA repair exonuclease SbcCD nuclease subunit
MHDFMVDVARYEKVDLFLCAGDIYERASTPRERDAVARWLIAMANVCPVVITRGNHDRKLDVDLMARLEAKHPIVVESAAGVHYVAGAAVLAMAWPERATLAAACPDMTGAELDATAQDLLRNVMRGLGTQAADFAGPKIGLGHFMIDGSVTSLGQQLIGEAMNVGLADLALLSCPVVIAGHIHKPQSWRHGECDIIYTGSPYRTKFGEVEEKSITLLEFDGPTLVNWLRIPTPCAQMLLLEDEWGQVFEDQPGMGWRVGDSLEDVLGAEIRFRFRFAPEHRVEATAAAEQLRRRLLDQGAAYVKLDPKVKPKSTAKAPEISKLESIEDKLLTLWTVRGSHPGTERAARLLAKARAVVDASPDHVAGGGGARFDSLRFRGIGVFKHEVHIDLASIPAKMIAFVGPNGAGKSTCLEMFGAAISRKTATHEGLTDLATERDAFVEVEMINGQPLKLKQTYDPIAGKGESFVTRPDGTSALGDSTSVKEFYAWAKQHLPSDDVLHAGQISAQRSYGFLDLKRSERGSVLLKALGLERYERMAKNASERAKAAKDEAAKLRTRLNEVPVLDVQTSRVVLAECERQVELEAEATKAARVAFERGKAAAQDVSRAMELAEQRRGVEKRLAALRSQRSDLEGRIAKNRELLAREQEIRAAVAKDAENRTALEAGRETLASLRAELESAVATERAARAAVAPYTTARQEAHKRIDRAWARLRDRDRVMAAAADAEQLRALVQERESDVARLTLDVERLTGLTIAGKDQRIDGLRSALTTIDESEDGDAPFQAWARSGVMADNDLAERVAGAPDSLRIARRDLALETQELATARTKLRDAEALAARASEMADAQDNLDMATVERDVAIEREAAASKAAADAVARVTTARAAVDQQNTAQILAEHAIATLAPVVALREHLERAEAMIADREASLVPVREQIAQAETEFAALPNTEDPKAIDIGALERSVAQHEASEQRARKEATIAQASLETALQTVERRAAIEQEIAASDIELADWTRLTQDMGRDGLQALEIDAAIPELNTTANELLSSCVGTRFAVELRTDRLSSDGKKMIDDLEVRVLDTGVDSDAGTWLHPARDDDASKYSPGELVIVSEAIALAITVRTCRQSGAENPTLIRDETGSALSPANGRAYMRMLRHAVDIIGADKCLFVTHSQELQELADCRIEFSADHKVTIGGAA